MTDKMEIMVLIVSPCQLKIDFPSAVQSSTMIANSDRKLPTTARMSRSQVSLTKFLLSFGLAMALKVTCRAGTGLCSFEQESRRKGVLCFISLLRYNLTPNQDL